MTDAVVPSPAATCGDIARCLGACPRAKTCGFLHRALLAARTRRALDGLSHDLLWDNGLTRADIAFVAEAVASGERDPTRDPSDRLNRSVTAG